MNAPTTISTSSGEAIVPSTFAGMPDHALQEVEIRRGTYVVQMPGPNGDGESYGPGSVLLVPPEEAAYLKRAGNLGPEFAPAVVQTGQDHQKLIELAHAGAVVGRA